MSSDDNSSVEQQSWPAEQQFWPVEQQAPSEPENWPVEQRGTSDRRDQPATPHQPTPDQPAQEPDPGQRPHPLTPLVQGWIGLVALAVFMFRDVLEHGFNPELWRGPRLIWSAGVLLVIGLGTLVIGYFSWRYTRFVLDADGLRIDRNFIHHQSNRVLYTKIQSVDIVQPFAARLLRLAAIRVDAGGEAKTLQFLSKSSAETLRDELMRRATAVRSAPRAATPAGEAPQGDPAQPDIAPLDEPTRDLVLATPRQLVLGAVTSSEFVASVFGLLVFGLVPFLITGKVWSAGIVIPAAFGLFGLISNRVIKEWNYRLSESVSGTLRISRGLTTTVNQTVPRDRIQGFSIAQSALGKLFGLWRVQIEVLGYQGEDADQGGSTVLLPAGDWSQVLTALDAVWPAFDPHRVALQPLPERGRWLRPLTWRTHGWGVDDTVVLHRGGRVVHTISVVHHSRVQSVRFSQGPLQRRLGLATAQAHITDGPVTLCIPSMDAEQASWLVRTELGRAQVARERELVRVAATESEQAQPSQPEIVPSFEDPASQQAWDDRGPQSAEETGPERE